MKITHNKVGQNLNTRDTGRAGKGEASKTKDAGKADAASALDTEGAKNVGALFGKDEPASRVELSGRAQDMKKMTELAKAAPDVREDRIAELQKLIDDGKYKVSSKDVADKMVDEESQWM